MQWRYRAASGVVESFIMGNNATGSIWFENAVLTVVPEPSAVALVAVGSALLLGYRSRRDATRA